MIEINLLLTTLVEYRLLNRILVRKYTPAVTLSILFIVRLVVGLINVRYVIAGTILGNAAYHGVLSILLYICLFRVGFVKAIFLITVRDTTLHVTFFVLLPFFYYMFSRDTPKLQQVLDILNWVSVVIWIILIEYIGRRFGNLRNELPTGYTLLLTLMIVFVYIALYTTFDFFLMLAEGFLTLKQAIGYFLFACFGASIFFYVVFNIDRQVAQFLMKQQYELQTAHFRSCETDWSKLAGFRHDMKNHLLCLDILLQQGNSAEAKTYMQNLTHTLSQIETPVQTGNVYADALLGVKLSDARARGIAMTVDMVLPPQGYIQPADLCCILSNALDNAIIACTYMENPADAWIRASSFLRQAQLIIEIKNSCSPASHPKQNQPPRRSYGLENMRTVVMRYGGVMDLSHGDSFILSILLPPTLL